MSEITFSQHTNSVESMEPIVHSQNQAPLGEYVTSNGHQDVPIPGLDEAILNPKLLSGESSRNSIISEKQQGHLESTGQSEKESLKSKVIFI
ncbi:hypothetical protein HYPSUDRAFT_484538 [Hypholoma sublateritium FD-334 SS-4]|uniref:Uncharacterized protein n=1 Tax=Hypholoma sublateritium (strain FD-334 SS-4) TaxID=945553 RepID=A0A0D2N3N8_HYPSF|nr:hypothetical protein HYPSUDRAFT_484538 [Hypholoma sublateritium FD-334 SS-4]